MRVIVKPGGIALFLGLAGVCVAFVAAPRVRDAVARSSGRPTFAAKAGDWYISAPPGDASMTVIPLYDLPSGNSQGVRFDVKKASPATPYSSQIGASVPSAVVRGQKLRLRFWGRAPVAGFKANVKIEQSFSPYSRSLTREQSFTTTWTRYEIPVTIGYDTEPKRTSILFEGGLNTGTVELAGLELLPG